MEESNVIESSNCLVANALIGASLVIWFFLAMLDDLSNVSGISR